MHELACRLPQARIGAGHYECERGPLLVCLREGTNDDIRALAKIETTNTQDVVWVGSPNVPCILERDHRQRIRYRSHQRKMEVVAFKHRLQETLRRASNCIYRTEGRKFSLLAQVAESSL